MNPQLVKKIFESFDVFPHDRRVPTDSQPESSAYLIFPADAYWARALITTAPTQARFVLSRHMDDALTALRTQRISTIFIDPHASDNDVSALRSVVRNRGLACTFVVVEDSAQRERVVWLLHQRLADRAINIPFRPRLLQALLARASGRAPAVRAAESGGVLLHTSDVELADLINERLADVAVIECNSCPALTAHLRSSVVGAVLIDIDVDPAVLTQAVATVRTLSSTVRLIGLRRSADTLRDAYLLGREGFNRIVTVPSTAETLRAACFGRRYDTQAFLHSMR